MNETVEEIKKQNKYSKFPMKILTYPNSKLRRICQNVEQKNEEQVRTLINRMFETMDFYGGIGLSAPQIGVSMNIIVVHVGEERHAMINPEIIEYSGEYISKEGCLSFPQQFAEIERFNHIKINFKNMYWEDQTLECDGLISACIQHEYDHIHGILFIDHISKLKKNMITKKMKKRKALR